MLKKHLLLLSMLQTLVLCSILVETEIFLKDSPMNRKFKRTTFIWN